MFGKNDKAIPVTFRQEIQFLGTGPITREFKVQLNSRKLELNVLPFPGFDPTLLVGSHEPDEILFHPVKSVSVDPANGHLICNSHVLYITIGSLYELKNELDLRIKYLYDGREQELNPNTKDLWQKLKDTPNYERLVYGQTVVWPLECNIRVRIAQNIKFVTPDDKEGEQFQFRKEILLRHPPMIGVHYECEGLILGILEHVAYDPMENQWTALSRPEDLSNYERYSEKGFTLFCEDGEKKKTAIRRYIEPGWQCRHMSLDDIKAILGR